MSQILVGSAGGKTRAIALLPEASGVGAVEHHFRKAHLRIVGYFLKPSNVIRLAELQDGNMLTHLDEAGRIAQALHRQLKE